MSGNAATISLQVRAVNRNHRGAPHTAWPIALAATAVVAGVAVATPLVAGQFGPPITEARVRALARQAQRESRGDTTAVVLALDRHVRETWGEFESFPLSIVHRDDLLVTLSTPYMAFRRAVVDVLLTKRRLEDSLWVETAVVSVAPARLGSPDIDAVLLTRDGRDVPPVVNGLKPMTFSNGGGESTVLHAGDVHFPALAFAPAAHVVLTLRVRTGDPFIYAFDETELAVLK